MSPCDVRRVRRSASDVNYVGKITKQPYSGVLTHDLNVISVRIEDESCVVV